MRIFLSRNLEKILSRYLEEQEKRSSRYVRRERLLKKRLNNMEFFNFKGSKVEVISNNGTALFNPYEIGECLELTNGTIANKIKELDEGIEKVRLSRTEVERLFEGVRLAYPLSNYGKIYLTEQGCYQFILASTSQRAKEFKKWLCQEVLPSIRKHGMYATPQTIEQVIENPESAIKVLMALKQERLEKEQAVKEKERAVARQREAVLREQEAIEAEEKARKEKAWISEKREVTAMVTASIAMRECEKLRQELGESTKFASILRVSIALKVPEKNFSCHALKRECKDLGLEWQRIPDPRFAYALAYPAKAWKNIYGVDIEKLFKR